MECFTYAPECRVGQWGNVTTFSGTEKNGNKRMCCQIAVQYIQACEVPKWRSHFSLYGHFKPQQVLKLILGIGLQANLGYITDVSPAFCCYLLFIEETHFVIHFLGGGGTYVSPWWLWVTSCKVFGPGAYTFFSHNRPATVPKYSFNHPVLKNCTKSPPKNVVVAYIEFNHFFIYHLGTAP